MPIELAQYSLELSQCDIQVIRLIKLVNALKSQNQQICETQYKSLFNFKNLNQRNYYSEVSS